MDWAGLYRYYQAGIMWILVREEDIHMSDEVDLKFLLRELRKVGPNLLTQVLHEASEAREANAERFRFTEPPDEMLLSGIEPLPVFTTTPSVEIVLHSIAVSLKRIADGVDELTKKNEGEQQ